MKKVRAFGIGSSVIAAGMCILIGGQVARADFSIGEPTILASQINTGQHDFASYISADGLQLLFSSGRYGGMGGYDLWLATRATVDDAWSIPQNLGPTINTFNNEKTPIFSKDGLSLYFSSDRPGGRGSYDIWVSIRPTLSAPWEKPVNLGSVVNSTYDESNPTLSSDGLSLYFSEYGTWPDHRSRPGGFGQSDIWVSTRSTTSAPWGAPMNLGETVNGPGGDYVGDVSDNGLVLFLYSNRQGSLGIWEDLYVARRISTADPWGNSTRLGDNVNRKVMDLSPDVSADGSTLYWSSWPTAAGQLDLYQAPILPIVDLNADDKVDGEDMAILIDHWHTSDPLCDIGPTPLGDGFVDIEDLIVMSEYLEPGFGRIAHWTLDEIEGDIAHDSVGSDNANVHGGAVWQPDAGQIAGALELDGVDDYVAPMCILNPSDGPFRIYAWIKGGAPGQVIASQTPTQSDLGCVFLAADPANGTLLTEAILPPLPLKSDMVITDGEWHEVGLDWDGGYRHLYVDDIEVAVDGMKLPGLVSTGWLNIGTGKVFESGSFWSGLIDDVRVYEQGVQ